MESQKRRSWKAIALFFMVCVLAFGVPLAMPSTASEVQAATVKQGWVQKNNNWYYYKNNRIQKSKWIYSNGIWYYVKSNGVMAENEFETVKGKTYYLGASGKMATSWKKVGKYWYYFDKTNGDMKTGFKKINGKRYYLSKNASRLGRMMENQSFKVKRKRYYAGTGGALITGFKEVNGKKYYFTTKGAKAKGWHEISGKWYYMDSAGVVQTGWFTDPRNGKKYYLSKKASNKGQMYTGTRKIGSKKYYFNSSGALQYEVDSGGSSSLTSNLTQTSSAKTLKGFLENAIKPVGSTLYIWGGGHGKPDDQRIGVNPSWATFYNKQKGSYNYQSHRFKQGAGLDCSGFVGWAVYQAMETKAYRGYYTTVSGSIGSMYSGKGMGTTKRSGKINNKYLPGDILYNSNHTWIVLGQCPDKSVVLVHSTPPAGVQIAGTPTPGGSYSSQAIALAQKYMKKYHSNVVKKFGLRSSTGTSYLSAYSMFRWNASTLKDPDGYRNKNASAILSALY